MDIVQSLIFSISKQHVTLYEQRILTKIVEHAQPILRGVNLREEIRQANKKGVGMEHPYDNVKFELPARYILDEKNQHYEYVYDAARSLMSRTFEYFDPKTKSWYSSPIIYNVSVKQRSGMVVFYVARSLFSCILDFRMGYSRFDLERALSLPTVAATRLYCIIASVTTCLVLQVGYLKKMFDVENKYKNTSDFIRRVVEPARLSLLEAGVTSFSYVCVREGRKITALRFYPIVQKNDISETRAAKGDEYNTFKLCELLLIQEGFTAKERAGKNKRLLVKFCRVIPSAQDLLWQIISRSQSSRIKDNKGYIINGMKSEVKHAEEKKRA